MPDQCVAVSGRKRPILAGAKVRRPPDRCQSPFCNFSMSLRVLRGTQSRWPEDGLAPQRATIASLAVLIIDLCLFRPSLRPAAVCYDTRRPAVFFLACLLRTAPRSRASTAPPRTQPRRCYCDFLCRQWPEWTRRRNQPTIRTTCRSRPG
jgi:hypothetical protein